MKGIDSKVVMFKLEGFFSFVYFLDISLIFSFLFVEGIFFKYCIS